MSCDEFDLQTALKHMLDGETVEIKEWKAQYRIKDLVFESRYGNGPWRTNNSNLNSLLSPKFILVKETFDWETAMGHLKDGKRVKRCWWMKESYLELDSSCIYDQYGTNPQFNLEYFTAEDWELA